MIDESIAHAREVEEYKRKCNKNSDCIDIECERCVEEHKQIAAWLEELKAYRNHVFSGEMTQAMLKEERNKAIDDFVNFANTMPTVEEEDGTIRPMWLGEMAERLKAGEKNE